MEYRREDWTQFQEITGLCQKAGVTEDRLQRLVLKELVDNALDVCGRCEVGRTEKGFFVQDDGPGIPTGRVAELFSIRRPLVSSKLTRLPTRGALGNGLRVVVGAIAASGGELVVETQGKRMRLIPQAEGHTMVLDEGSGAGNGLRVELTFGSAMPGDPNPLGWAMRAIAMAGKSPIYRGRPSPYWDDAGSFHARCKAAVDATARDVIEEFDGCSGGKAGRIAAQFKGRSAASLTREEAAQLLKQARELAAEVKPSRLRRARQSGVEFPDSAYAHAANSFKLSGTSRPPYADSIPYTVEAWAAPADEDSVEICVNRTPAVAETGVFRPAADKSSIAICGCGLEHKFTVGRRSNRLILNIQAPFVPITSDGKAPNLRHMLEGINTAIETAAERNRRANQVTGAGRRLSQKEVVISHLPEALLKASGGEGRRCAVRQLFYAIRPYLIEKLGKQPDYKTFSRILTDYENEHGVVSELYRDTRGIVYHPHLHQEIPLGTLAVEKYRRPEWLFNKIVYCEKEGFFPVLRSLNWPERFDCALLTSKGMATRAARDLLDLLGDSGEEITFFCVHDADAYGTNIFHSLQEATTARDARRVEIINLGLEPWEGVAMGLDVESVKGSKKNRHPVAPYVRKRRDRDWVEWLQTNRIELNAMTTPQFESWLSEKMVEHGHEKVVPPEQILANHLDRHLRDDVTKRINRRILLEHSADEQVKEVLSKLGSARDELARQLPTCVGAELQKNPVEQWCQPVGRLAEGLVRDSEHLL